MEFRRCARNFPMGVRYKYVQYGFWWVSYVCVWQSGNGIFECQRQKKSNPMETKECDSTQMSNEMISLLTFTHSRRHCWCFWCLLSSFHLERFCSYLFISPSQFRNVVFNGNVTDEFSMRLIPFDFSWSRSFDLCFLKAYPPSTRIYSSFNPLFWCSLTKMKMH